MSSLAIGLPNRASSRRSEAAERKRRRGRSTSREKGDDEDGFALLEMIIAATLLIVSMLAIASELGTQMLSVSSTSNHQVADGLLDQAMEEVRALPYQIVANGLSTSDSTIATDPDIAVTGSAPNQIYTFTLTGETIPHGALSYTQAPFVPHSSTTILDHVGFTVSAYPTNVTGVTGAYRVTIVVSWNGNGQGGVTSVSAETVVYSASSGCLTSTNHPFAAPCQPLLYGGALSGKGSINVSAGPGWTGDPISGVSLDSFELSLANSSSQVQVEQTSRAFGGTQTSGAEWDDGAGLLASGSVAANSEADNDPGTAQNTNASASAAQSSTFLQAGMSGSNWIGAQPGSQDSGVTTSTAAASSSPACVNLQGSTQTTGLPCASGSVDQSGTATLQMGLAAGSSSLGTTTLASVASTPGAYPDESFISRVTSSGGSACGSTSGDGCIHAGAQEAYGTVTLGGLPSQFLTDHAAPAGWGSSLLTLNNYSAQASSESGVSASNPSASVPIPGAPTPSLSYWNGTGYSTLTLDNWGTSPPTVTIPTVSITDSAISSGAVSLTMSASIILGPITTVANPATTTSGCSSICAASAVVSSVVEGDIVYQITQGTTTIADVSVEINLGELDLSTSYQAAP